MRVLTRAGAGERHLLAADGCGGLWAGESADLELNESSALAAAVAAGGSIAGVATPWGGGAGLGCASLFIHESFVFLTVRHGRYRYGSSVAHVEDPLRFPIRT